MFGYYWKLSRVARMVLVMSMILEHSLTSGEINCEQPANFTMEMAERNAKKKSRRPFLYEQSRLCWTATRACRADWPLRSTTTTPAVVRGSSEEKILRLASFPTWCRSSIWGPDTSAAVPWSAPAGSWLLLTASLGELKFDYKIVLKTYITWLVLLLIDHQKKRHIGQSTLVPSSRRQA